MHKESGFYGVIPTPPLFFLTFEHRVGKECNIEYNNIDLPINFNRVKLFYGFLCFSLGLFLRCVVHRDILG